MRKTKHAIKICQVSTVDASLRFLLLGQIQHLQKLGYEVHGAATKGTWVKDLEQSGVVFWNVPMTRRIWTPFADFVALIRLLKLFRREKYDIVHTHTPKASFLGQVAAFLVGVPVRIYTIHGLFFLETSSWRRKLVFATVERIMALLVHRAFFVNKEDMDTVRREHIYSARKMRYLGGDIDTAYFDPDRFSAKDKEDVKRKLGIPLQCKVVGIVARLVWEKGYADLFRAFSLVTAEHPNTLLLVVGPEEPNKTDGFEAHQAVKRYNLSGKALFLGERTNTAELYSIMDIFVLPSYREGLGLSLLEASAMARPVVGTNIRGCREAVEHGRTGLLVPVQSPALLADAISTLLLHPSQADAMGKRGRAKIMKEFAKEKIFHRIEEEYSQLIHERL